MTSISLWNRFRYPSHKIYIFGLFPFISRKINPGYSEVELKYNMFNGVTPTQEGPTLRALSQDTHSI